MILAPLRGVTIRCFRETFADEIRAAGFTEAVTPFIAAISGYDPLKDRELLKPLSTFTFSKQTRNATGSLPMNWGVRWRKEVEVDNGVKSSLSLSGS